MSDKDMKDIEVPDVSQDFDDCLGKKETVDKPGSLAEFLGMADVPEDEDAAWKEHNYQNWREHWQGMPEFESNDMNPKKDLKINFRSVEDFLKFSEILGQNLTEKTKSVWWPPREKDQNSLRRWLDESEVED